MSRPLTSTTFRLGTSQSRSRFASRPQTAGTFADREGSYVVAIMESRGVNREIGIAALDKNTARVDLVQLADCQTYVKTVNHLELHYPAVIIVPDANAGPGSSKRGNTVLLRYLEEVFPGVPIEPVLRKYWNETVGLDFINQLCVDDDDRAATLVAVSNKYFALSATCALFKHAESKLNIRYYANSLKIRYLPAEDSETARNLELVSNVTQRKSQHSLMGLLDQTFTPMGTRLLRMNVLSPLTVQATIEQRLDAVDELIQNEDRFSKIRDVLKSIANSDIDKLISSMAANDTTPTASAKIASMRVAQMLSLRNFLQITTKVCGALIDSRSDLLRILGKMLSDRRLQKLEAVIADSLNEHAVPQKGGGLASLNTRVYAIKANRNRLLDVARETFKENIGDIFQLTKDLSEEHSIPLATVYQENGFILTASKKDVEGELPKGFINVTSKGQKWFFSSMELKKRNARLKDALDEALMLSAKTITDLVHEIITDVGALYMTSEAIALLDVLWSFAHCAILRNYVRPEFTGTLAIKAGRHPILEKVQPSGTVVPNDVYCSDNSSFQLIHGANMSGKSTYLRQIALLCVMAMCGCFVPVEYGSFRIHTSLLTRLSNDDDIERSLSTFSNEMASSAMILGLATSDSLVLIDELGRGTSPRDGVGISHSIAESLIGVKAFTFFATHFHELTTTLSRHPAVVQLHLAVQKTKRSTANFGLVFNHRILDGPPDDVKHYGLEIAHLGDLPDQVRDEATRVAHKLAEIETRRDERSGMGQVVARRKALLRLRTQLIQTYKHSKLPDEDLERYLMSFQKDIVKTLGNNLAEMRR